MRAKGSATSAQLKLGLIIVLIVLIVGLASQAFSQTRTQRELAAKSETYLTEFNNMNLNFVNPRVQDFLDDQLDLVPSGEPEYNFADGQVTVSETYRKKVHTDGKDLTLQVIYKAKPEGNDLIIESSQIKGFDVYVIEFFIKYWKTTLNFDNVKSQELLTNYWITDRASLSISDQGAVIDVIKN